MSTSTDDDIDVIGLKTLPDGGLRQLSFGCRVRLSPAFTIGHICGSSVAPHLPFPADREPVFSDHLARP